MHVINYATFTAQLKLDFLWTFWDSGSVLNYVY